MHVLTDREMYIYFNFDTPEPMGAKAMKYGDEMLKIRSVNRLSETFPEEVILPPVVGDRILYLPDNCNYLFNGVKNCKYIDFSNLIDTSNIHNMSGMFMFSDELEEVVFGEEFDTKFVTDIDRMFYDCEKLKKVDMSMFNVSEVVSAMMIFYGCCSLRELYFPDLSNFRLSRNEKEFMMLRAQGQLPVENVIKDTIRNDLERVQELQKSIDSSNLDNDKEVPEILRLNADDGTSIDFNANIVAASF